jgi:hypothetical protein
MEGLMSVVAAGPAMSSCDRRWRDMGETKRYRLESEAVEGLDEVVWKRIFFAEVGQRNRRLGP